MPTDVGDSHAVAPRRSSLQRRERRTVKRVVSFSPEEYKAIVARAQACGRTPARFIREASLGAVPKERRNMMADEIVLQLGRIGNNINQLAREANAASHFPAEAKLDAALAELHAAILRVG